MYQFLKCMLVDEQAAQTKLCILKLRSYSTEAPYNQMMDGGCNVRSI